MKSTVAKGSQKHTSGSWDRTSSQEGRSSRTSSNTQLGDPEKKKLRDKPHRWIESRVKCLDPASYMEEINSLRYFGRNAGCFALQIMAIADWGRKFMDVGFKYPIPMFPQFLFTPLPESHQGGVQVLVKPSQVNMLGGDMCNKSREAWKWMVAVLQFWGDEASSADGVVYRGRDRPISALVEYVLNTINPGLEPRSKITWDDVVIRTPWMAKRLHGMTATQEKTVRRQALPVPGMSSELEIALERRYSEHILSSALGRGKLVVENPTAPSPKPITSPPRLTKARRGDVLKLHLKRATQGEGWSHVEPKDSGLDVGHPYQTPKEANQPQESKQVTQPGCSLLTSELLAPGKELIEDLDYEDVEETDPGQPDPEIIQAVAHIPQADAWADVEMQESHSPLGFEPRLPGPGMMSTWSVQTPLNWGRHPRLRLRRTKCWMKRFPGLLELVGRVPTKTLAAQKTINFPGPYSPENPCISLKTDYFPAAIGLETEVPKMWDKETYSILIGFTFGADMFRASQTGPLFVI